MNMKFGPWNVRSFYKASSLKTVANELASTQKMEVAWFFSIVVS